MALSTVLWIRHVVLPARLKGREIGGLLSDLEEAKVGLVQAMADVPAQARDRKLRRPPLASPADIVAHLTAIDTAYVEALRKMSRGDGKGVPFEAYAPFAGSRGAAWPKLVESFEASHGQLIQALIACPVTARGPHPWFGPLNRNEWAAIATIHYDYHRKQLRSLAKRRQPKPVKPPAGR